MLAFRFLLTSLCSGLIVGTSSRSSTSNSVLRTTKECPCALQDRPDKAEKALTARWMAHSLDWGVLTTISSRLTNTVVDSDSSDNSNNNIGISDIVPFGNVYSFVDGTCENATGIPYFYGSFMDQSLTDSLGYSMVSLTLSEASLSSVCVNKHGLDACTLGTRYGDPESPVCARLSLTGKLVVLDNDVNNGNDDDEYHFAKKSLFQRHPAMEHWPEDHNWVIFKIDIQDVWLIDYFGGASILSPQDYFAANLINTMEKVITDDER